ncbi:unnamed protein product [Sphagnum balticum]
MFFSHKKGRKVQEGWKKERKGGDGGGGGYAGINNEDDNGIQLAASRRQQQQQQQFGSGLWEKSLKRSSSSNGVLQKGSAAVVVEQQQQQDAASIEWEMRPGGMLVQRRDVPDAGTPFGPLVKIKVSYGLISHDITAPAFASFGDVKKLLVSVTGLTPKEQRLLFKGIEKEDSEALHMAGVKDKAKLILMEDPAAQERKVQEQYKQEQIARSYQIVTSIQAEVDKLAEQVSTSEGSFNSGDGISVSELRRLNEDLMQKLLRLDGVEAKGEVMILRKTEVKRVQGLVEAVDRLRAALMKPPPKENQVVVTTQWETFDGGMGSLAVPPTSSATVNANWEMFG